MKSEIPSYHLAPGTLGAPIYSPSLSTWTFPNSPQATTSTIAIGSPTQIHAGIPLTKVKKVAEKAGDNARVTTWNVLKDVYPNLVTTKEWVHRDEIVSGGLMRAWEDYDPLNGTLMAWEGDRGIWAGGIGPSQIWLAKRERVNGTFMKEGQAEKVSTWANICQYNLLPKDCNVGAVRGVCYGKLRQIFAIRGTCGTGIWRVEGWKRLVWIPYEFEGLGVHADLAIEPSDGRLFAIIDRSGLWQLQQLSGLTNETSNKIIRSGKLDPVTEEDAGTGDPSDRNFNQDGWARISFILAGSALLLCSRTQVQIVVIKNGQAKNIDIWKQKQDSWILDVRTCNRDSQLFILTNYCIYWIDLDRDALFALQAQDTHKVLLFVKHNHNPLDLGLQIRLLETKQCV
jgi:hypothetical protein